MPAPSRHPSRRAILIGVSALLAAPAGAASAQALDGWRLMMVTARGCVYCDRWQAQIGPGHAASASGRAAPLFEVDVDGPFPDGLALARRPRITPSFILLSDRVERGRVEGYVGQDHFYPVLHRMMQQAGLTPPGQDRNG